jgi:hypothetical protein
LEGTSLIEGALDQFSEKLLQGWLYSCQIEQIDPMLSEISSLKGILQEAIR